MIRTSFSCLVLFSSLLLGNRLLQQGIAFDFAGMPTANGLKVTKPDQDSASDPNGSSPEEGDATSAPLGEFAVVTTSAILEETPGQEPVEAESSGAVLLGPTNPEPFSDTQEKTSDSTSLSTENDNKTDSDKSDEPTLVDPQDSPDSKNEAPVDKKTKEDAPDTASDEKTGEHSEWKAPVIELSPELRSLRDRVRLCLANYYVRTENVEDHSPWGVMHALIAYGIETQILVDNRRVNACGYLCWNGSCRGMQLMYLDDGKLNMRIGPGVQGHPGQFLAMLAQSKVKRDYPLHVLNRKLAVEDLIEYEKLTCRPKTELTFKLIGLTHYLDTNATWKSNDGQDWSLPRLIKEELAQPVIGAACGGTHRLTGLAYAARKREKKGETMDGQWLRARKYLDAYHDYTFSLQNPDGSFSTEWFKGRSDWGEAPRRLETTGHILEWMVFSLSHDQLTEPRVVRAVSYLTNLLTQNSDHRWEIGPKGHALHALAIYDERVFGLSPGKRALAYMTELKKHKKR